MTGRREEASEVFRAEGSVDVVAGCVLDVELDGFGATEINENRRFCWI